MEKKEKLFDSWRMRALLIITLFVVGFSARMILLDKYEERQTAERLQSYNTDKDYNEGGLGREMADYAAPVSMDHPIMQAFEAYMPGQDIIFGCEGDVTDDGLSDLIILYRIKEGVRLVVATDSGDGTNYEFSEPIPAPYENQKVRFFNMDKEGEMEFVVQGSKHGKAGYGIFRMIDGQPVNLFAEGMEDC